MLFARDDFKHRGREHDGLRILFSAGQFFKNIRGEDCCQWWYRIRARMAQRKNGQMSWSYWFYQQSHDPVIQDLSSEYA